MEMWMWRTSSFMNIMIPNSMRLLRNADKTPGRTYNVVIMFDYGRYPSQLRSSITSISPEYQRSTVWVCRERQASSRQSVPLLHSKLAPNSILKLAK